MLAHDAACLLALAVMQTTAGGMKRAGEYVQTYGLSSICSSQNPTVSSGTQTVQSTQSTFTAKCTISVHIHHIAWFIYSLSLLTSSEPIQKLFQASQMFKRAHVCLYATLTAQQGTVRVA